MHQTATIPVLPTTATAAASTTARDSEFTALGDPLKPVRRGPLRRLHREAQQLPGQGTRPIHLRCTLIVRVFLSFHFVAYYPCTKLQASQETQASQAIPLPIAKNPRRAVIEAYHQLMPSTRVDRVSYPHASETIEGVVEIFQDLGVTDPFPTNEETSFPRADYTPYVMHIDCRDKGRPGSFSSSDE